MIGLGLALARRDKQVLVVTGDGELLMNIGSLATIAVMNPPNLSVICVDNGHYGETGYQRSHTSLGVDLEKIAAGSGIKRTLTIETEAEIASGARMIREGNGSSFVLLRVKPTEPPKLQARPRPRQHPHPLPLLHPARQELISAIVRARPSGTRSPLPLMGRGWGWGEGLELWPIRLRAISASTRQLRRRSCGGSCASFATTAIIFVGKRRSQNTSSILLASLRR